MSASLVSLNYRVPSCDMHIDRLPLVIGSSPEAGICLDDPSVSQYHCRIAPADGHFVVTDLGSVHGTFVNGEKVTESPLVPGDTLSVGMLTFFLQVLHPEEQQPKRSDQGIDIAADGPGFAPMVYVMQ